jgi:hypothetical protein
MLRRLQSSLAYRAKWARLGIVYVRKPKLDSIKCGPKRVQTRVFSPSGTRCRIVSKRYAVGFEIHCPGGALSNWALKSQSPSKPHGYDAACQFTLAGPFSQMEVRHFVLEIGSDESLKVQHPHA